MSSLMQRVRHQGLWGYNVPPTFAACPLRGLQLNSHSTPALGISASCHPNMTADRYTHWCNVMPRTRAPEIDAINAALIFATSFSCPLYAKSVPFSVVEIKMADDGELEMHQIENYLLHKHLLVNSFSITPLHYATSGQNLTNQMKQRN